MSAQEAQYFVAKLLGMLKEEGVSRVAEQDDFRVWEPLRHGVARQRSMTTKIDLDCRSKPAQLVTIALPAQESRLGQIHLLCHILHPPLISWLRQNAYARWITCKRPVSKSVYLKNRQSHTEPPE